MAIVTGPAWMTRVDQFWVVKVPRNITLQRLKERGVSEADALARMANQPPVEDQITGKLVVINNDSSLNDLRAKIARLWQDL
jgi:dephospho-CoA kinase